MLIDTHAHLNFEKFQTDLPEVLERAREKGIDTIINIGARLEDSKKSVEMASKYPQIYATIGIHPTNAQEWSPAVKVFIENELKFNPKVVGVGETGLDYFHLSSPIETQKEVFKSQIELAKKHWKPLVVHNRKAAHDVWQLLQEANYFNCVFHCFSEDLPFAKKLWEKGIYTSFNGTVTYPKNSTLQEVAREAPKELYFLETDCPFLSPQNKRGQRNEPSNIRDIAAFLADLRSTTLSQIAAETSQNAKKFFGIK